MFYKLILSFTIIFSAALSHAAPQAALPFKKETAAKSLAAVAKPLTVNTPSPHIPAFQPTQHLWHQRIKKDMPFMVGISVNTPPSSTSTQHFSDTNADLSVGLAYNKSTFYLSPAGVTVNKGSSLHTVNSFSNTPSENSATQHMPAKRPDKVNRRLGVGFETTVAPDVTIGAMGSVSWSRDFQRFAKKEHATRAQKVRHFMREKQVNMSLKMAYSF